MKKSDDELAIRNPDWDKFVVVFNDAVVAERKEKQSLVDALKNLVTECKRQDIKLGAVIGDAEAALAKVKQ